MIVWKMKGVSMKYFLQTSTWAWWEERITAMCHCWVVVGVIAKNYWMMLIDMIMDVCNYYPTKNEADDHFNKWTPGSLTDLYQFWRNSPGCCCCWVWLRRRWRLLLKHSDSQESLNKNSSFKKSLLADVRTVKDEFQKAEEVIWIYFNFLEHLKSVGKMNLKCSTDCVVTVEICNDMLHEHINDPHNHGWAREREQMFRARATVILCHRGARASLITYEPRSWEHSWRWVLVTVTSPSSWIMLIKWIKSILLN